MPVETDKAMMPKPTRQYEDRSKTHRVIKVFCSVCNEVGVIRLPRYIKKSYDGYCAKCKDVVTFNVDFLNI